MITHRDENMKALVISCPLLQRQHEAQIIPEASIPKLYCSEAPDLKQIAEKNLLLHSSASGLMKA